MRKVYACLMEPPADPMIPGRVDTLVLRRPRLCRIMMIAAIRHRACVGTGPNGSATGQLESRSTVWELDLLAEIAARRDGKHPASCVILSEPNMFWLYFC